MKFFYFMSHGVGLFTPCFVPRGGFLYDCDEGRAFAPFRSYPGDLFWGKGGGGGWFWMKLIPALGT